MERITSNQVVGLMEAYNAVYAPKINEEQIQEDFENWVYSLVDEGEDLSEYTWDEMYEAYNYINEQIAGEMGGTGLGGAALAGMGALASGAGYYGAKAINAARTLMSKGDSNTTKKTTPKTTRLPSPAAKPTKAETNIAKGQAAATAANQNREANAGKPSTKPTGSFLTRGRAKVAAAKAEKAAAAPAKPAAPTPPTPAARPTAPSGASGRAAKAAEKITGAAKRAAQPTNKPQQVKPATPTTTPKSPEPPAPASAAPTTTPNTSGGGSSSSSGGGGKPPQKPATFGDAIAAVKNAVKPVANAVKPVANAANQVLGKPARDRFLGTTVSGKLTRAAATTGLSALDIGGKAYDPTKPSALSKIGSIGPGAVGTALQGFGNVGLIKDTSMGTGARGTGSTLRQIGREMRDQGATPAKKLLPGLKESPNWDSAPKPKGVATLTLGGERKVFIPGQGWQYPTTARRWARAQGYENWDKIPNPSQPSQKPKPEQQSQVAKSKTAGTPVPDSQLTAADRRSLEAVRAARSAGSSTGAPGTSAGSQQSSTPRPQPAAAKPTPTKPAIERSPQGYAVGTTAGGTKFERRAATGAELAAARDARQKALAAAPTDKKGAEEAAVKAGVGASKPTSPTVPARNGFGASTANMNAKSSVSSVTAPTAFKPATINAAPSTSPTASGSVAPITKTIASAPTTPPVAPKKAPDYSTREGDGKLRRPEDRLFEGVDAYNIVLEYLFDNGDANTIAEAEYLMTELDENFIQSLVETYHANLLAEEVEAWVNELVEEGYDLSEYTWDDMVDYYFTEAKGDGNLANNYPPYDKVTRGDVISGALGQDQMGGKNKSKKSKKG